METGLIAEVRASRPGFEWTFTRLNHGRLVRYPQPPKTPRERCLFEASRDGRTWSLWESFEVPAIGDVGPHRSSWLEPRPIPALERPGVDGFLLVELEREECGRYLLRFRAAKSPPATARNPDYSPAKLFAVLALEGPYQVARFETRDFVRWDQSTAALIAYGLHSRDVARLRADPRVAGGALGYWKPERAGGFIQWR